MTDVHATMEELRGGLGVDDVTIRRSSSKVLEVAWVILHEKGLVVTDRGQTWDGLELDSLAAPDEDTMDSICGRFGVAVGPREEVGYAPERRVPAGGDVRTAVRAVLAARDAVSAAASASEEAGGGWSDDILGAGREHGLPLDEDR
jgi:hypothetical protein